MFTGVAGFALLRDDHVRVDIFYRPASIRWKAIADLIGVVLFLLPFMIVVFIYALPYVERSWRLYEGSANVGGMPGLFVLKSFILVFCDSRRICRASPWAAARSWCWPATKNDCPSTLRYRRDTAPELAH